MTDLTEQWKKGELPEGWYYVKVIPDFEYPNDIAFYTGGYFELYSDNDIEEVLAPVPSYEEWQRIFHYAGKYEYEYTSCVMDYENLKQENQQLKELLKECKDVIKDVDTYCTKNADEGYILIYRIDNAIGDNDD